MENWVSLESMYNANYLQCQSPGDYILKFGLFAMFTTGGGPSVSGYGSGARGDSFAGRTGRPYEAPSLFCMGVFGGTGGPELEPEPDGTRWRGCRGAGKSAGSGRL